MAKTTTPQPTGGLGEFFSGRYYPTSTALDPEVEATLRARYAEAYALLARTENQWKTETIESHSNIQVALFNAYAKSLSSAASGAMAGATSQRAQADMIRSLNSTFSGLLNMTSGELPKDVTKGFNDASTVLTQGFSAKNIELLGELTNMSDEQAKNHIASEYGGVIQKLFGSQNASTVSLHATSGTPLGQMYNIRNKARGIVGGQADAAYTGLLAQLLSSDDDGLKQLGATLGQEKVLGDHSDLVNSIIDNGLMIEQSGVYRRTTAGEQAERQDREYGRKAYEEQLQYARSLGAGIPPHMFAELMSLYDAGGELVKKGPEAYAAGLAGMKSPAEFEKARSVLDEGLKTLSPTDKLTQSVRNWFHMPGFSRWAAINGFKDPLAATRYASNHPSEFAAFVRLNETDPNISLEELQGRMQQEGAFRTKGPFKTKYLSKPIERALGVGFTPPAGYRMFPGDVSMKEVEGAIEYATEGLEDLKKEGKKAPKGGGADATARAAAQKAQAAAAAMAALPGIDDEDPAQDATRPATPAGIEVTAADTFLYSITDQAKKDLSELEGPARARELRRILRAAKRAKKTLDPESTGRTTLIEAGGTPPLVETPPEPPAAQPVTTSRPRRRGSYIQAWGGLEEDREEAEAAVQKFEFGDELTREELLIIFNIPSGSVEWSQRGRARKQKLDEAQDEHGALATWEAMERDRLRAKDQAQWPPISVLPTAPPGPPEPEPGPPPEGYPTGPVDMEGRAAAATTQTQAFYENQARTSGITGTLGGPAGTAWSIPPGGNAALAHITTQERPLTQDDIESLGGSLGTFNESGEFVPNPPATAAADIATGTPPPVDGTTTPKDIGNGLSNRARRGTP